MSTLNNIILVIIVQQQVRLLVQTEFRIRLILQKTLVFGIGI